MSDKTTTNNEEFPGLEGWSKEQSREADAEGWNLFDCGFGAKVVVKLMRDDWMDYFPSDQEACEHVVNRANEGSKLHMSALSFLEKHHKSEYDSVLLCTGNNNETPGI